MYEYDYEDLGFLEGGTLLREACEILEATPTFGLKPCPFSIVFESNYQSNRSIFERIFC